MSVANIWLFFELSQTVDLNFFYIFWWNFFKINTLEKIFGESFCKIKNYLSSHQKFFCLILIYTKSYQNAKIVLNGWNSETKWWKLNNLSTWGKFFVKNHLHLPSEIVFPQKKFFKFILFFVNSWNIHFVSNETIFWNKIVTNK